MMNLPYEDGIQKLFDIARDANLPTATRLEILSAIQDIMAGKARYDERIQELEMQLFRNPSFPEDLIGYWDDESDENDRQ